ncbi:MAG: VOC family protein [Methanomassiliicoccales archaeon]|nr:VOC family protein [Methanomassiliicoccales archaeon]
MEEATRFYISIFKDSKIISISRYGEAGPGPKGSIMTVVFRLAGQEFMGLDGGPMFKFSPAVSFVVNCENQKEVDEYWEKLSKGGEKGVCGWLTDKYGVSWQIVPIILGKMMIDPDPIKVDRVTKAMLKMKKLDIATLKKAYEG